jgi:nucleoid-associated protein YgaU
MALSTKLAMLTCLGFTAGMCWLVSLVARPIVEMPTPLVARGPAVPAETVFVSDDRSREARMVARFARPSPLESAEPPVRDARVALVVAAQLPPLVEPDTPSLPPLQVPDAPVVALADRLEAAIVPEIVAAEPSGGPVEIPKAIIGDRPPQRPLMLAALTRDAEAGDGARPAEPEPDPAQRTYRKYKVRSGDTLVKILRRHFRSDDQEALNVLLAANPQVAQRRDRIFPGEYLNIPDLHGPDAAPAVARSMSGGPVADGRAPRSAKVRYYKIQKRDSLASIARRFLNDERRWPEIAKLNEMRNADKVMPGMLIKLPVPPSNDT